MAANPYAVGLALVTRRELSAAQLAERLRRRGFDAEATADAVARLQRERAVDDDRTALVHARRAARIARRGPRRTEREIVALGIDPATARTAVAEVYGQEPEETVIERALERRLPADAPVADRSHFGKLYRYLLRQGFDPHLVTRTLRARAGAAAPPDDPLS